MPKVRIQTLASRPSMQASMRNWIQTCSARSDRQKGPRRNPLLVIAPSNVPPPTDSERHTRASEDKDFSSRCVYAWKRLAKDEPEATAISFQIICSCVTLVWWQVGPFYMQPQSCSERISNWIGKQVHQTAKCRLAGCRRKSRRSVRTIQILQGRCTEPARSKTFKTEVQTQVRFCTPPPPPHQKPVNHGRCRGAPVINRLHVKLRSFICLAPSGRP